MIVSKGALASAERIASTDRPGAVYFYEDGCVATTNRQVGVVISPLKKDIVSKVPLPDSGPICLVLGVQSVKDILKSIPRDTLYGGLLEFADIRFDGKRVQVVTSDGKRKSYLSFSPIRAPEFKYRGILDEVVALNCDDTRKHIVLDRRRVGLLWDAADKAAPNVSGELPLWMSVGPRGELVVRAVNIVTGQRFVGLSAPIDAEWLDLDSWERGVKRKTVKIKRKKSHAS